MLKRGGIEPMKGSDMIDDSDPGEHGFTDGFNGNLYDPPNSTDVGFDASKQPSR